MFVDFAMSRAISSTGIVDGTGEAPADAVDIGCRPPSRMLEEADLSANALAELALDAPRLVFLDVSRNRLGPALPPLPDTIREVTTCQK